MPSILIVCTANVCRSPLAAVRLRELLNAAGFGRGLEVESAGSAAAGDAPMCSRAAERLAGEVGARTAAAHASRRITRDMLDAADLVLVPDLANRARVVSLHPSARRRTLLLRDAAVHAPTEPGRGTGDEPGAEQSGPLPRTLADDAFTAWVDGLRSARMSAPHITAHRFSFRPHVARDLEIADGHNLGTRRHRQTLDAVEASVAALALSLATVDIVGRSRQ